LKLFPGTTSLIATVSNFIAIEEKEIVNVPTFCFMKKE
jgi:hypothetical protein